jgi:hypothetical protein
MIYDVQAGTVTLKLTDFVAESPLSSLKFLKVTVIVLVADPLPLMEYVPVKDPLPLSAAVLLNDFRVTLLPPDDATIPYLVRAPE